MFWIPKKPRKPKTPMDALVRVGKRKVRKESRKIVKKVGGPPAGGFFDWLFGK